MSRNIVTIILAAGLGKRMKSGLAKVLHPVAGRPMFLYPVRVAEEISSAKIIAVVGHQADRVQDALAGRNVEIALQAEQKGTADAVRTGMDSLKDYKGTVVILCGDVLLIISKTIKHLLAVHDEEKASVTVLTTEVEDPSGYGRGGRKPGGFVFYIIY